MPYLTPNIDLLSESPDCRQLMVSGDLWYLVTGALSELSKKWNWEQFGTATPEQMSEYFMDVLDDYQASECAKMNFVQSTTDVTLLNLFNVSGNAVYTINDASLPAYAQGASIIYVMVDFSRLTGTTTQSLVVTDQNLMSRQRLYVNTNDNSEQVALLVPMAGGGCRFQALGTSTTIGLIVNLIGWM